MSNERHITTGGIIIIEPWLTPENWKTGKPFMFNIDEPDMKICRMNTSEIRDGHSFFEFHFLVGTPEKVQHFNEEHLLGLFSIETMKKAFEENGLNVQFDEKGLIGRGLYIGTLK